MVDNPNDSSLVNITLKFKELRPLKKSFSKDLKFNELEQFFLSKLKLSHQVKKNGVFTLDQRDKSNNIRSGTYELDLNEIIDLLFDQQNNDCSSQFSQFIPRNELEIKDENIGDGSFGILNKCKYSKSTNSQYAFKSFKHEQERSFDSFSKEISAYSKLNHPSIPKFIGVSFDSEKKFGFLMEYINGDDMLKCNDLIDEKDNLEYVYQLADVISYLHNNECIHRDLKPNNIIIKSLNKLSSKPRLFLIDYGLSKLEDDHKQLLSVSTIVRDNMNVYKFLFGDDLFKHKSFDIWALGCIIYFLYTKKHPCNYDSLELKKLVDNGKYFFKKDEFKDEFIYELIKDCCDLDHTKRKTAQEIRDKVFIRMHCNTNKVTPLQESNRNCYDSSLFIQRMIDQIEDKQGDNAIINYFRLGEEQLIQGRLDEALKNHEYCLDLKIKRKFNEESMIKSYLAVANIHSISNNFSKAEEYLLKAEQIAEPLGNQNKMTADIYFNLGNIYQDLNDFIKSEDYLEKSLKIKLEHEDIGEDHFLTAGSYLELGKTQRKLCKLSKSLESLEKAKSIYEEVYYDNYPIICDVNVEIGKTLYMQSQFHNAIKSFNKAKIKLKSNNPDSCELANVYSHLGSVHSNLQDLKKAEKLHKKSLEIYIKNNGENDFTCASCYNNIGLIYKNTNEFQKADLMLERALKIFQEQPVHNSNMIASCLMNIGLNHASNGYCRKAEEYLERAKKMMENNGKETIDLADVYFNIGCIKMNLPSTYQQAKEMFMKSLRIRESILGKVHYDIASIYYNLGSICLAENQIIKAVENYNKVLEIYDQLYSKYNIFSADFSHKVAVSFNNNKLFEYSSCFFTKAVDYQKGITFNRDNFKINDETAESFELSKKISQEKLGKSYLALGNAYVSQGKNFKYAKEAFANALEIFKLIEGNLGENTTECHTQLGKVLQIIGKDN